MGCTAYGLLVRTSQGEFRAMETTPVLVGCDDLSQALELSTCGRYLIVHGSFSTYVLHLEEISISLFKSVIRERIHAPHEDFTIWSEENPIYGRDSFHLDGTTGKHYFLQFPFVRDKEFNKVFGNYHSLRVKQILEARKAI